MNLDIPPLFNYEIDNFLSNYSLCHYRGVFSSNNIPKLVQNFIFICNLSNTNQKGSHFIVICKNNSDLFIFDPLALNICNTDLFLFIEQCKKKCSNITKINNPIQSILSQSCGLFCIFFVFLYHAKLKNKGRIPLQVFNKTNLIQNDQICINNIKLLLKYI